MTRAIVSTALHKAAKEHTSKAGKQFVTFTLRENVNGTTRWWSAIAFDEAVIAAVLSMEIGEPFAAAGAIDAEIYAAAGSESRINWRITVDAVLLARKPKAKPEGTKPKPKEANGRDRAGSSWASPSASAGSVPFNDAVPFAPEWR